ncbi:MAG: response regulator transcription factor [Clostridiales bacterium]|nr:response regulator transcription factor [Clostridiales bacterium]
MTILIIDDDRIVCSALKSILEQEGGFRVLAMGESYEDAVLLYEQHQPDILLMDIRMGEKTGLDAAETIFTKNPDAKILFLTTFADEEYILRALQIGAKGYLLKQDYEAIAPSLRAVASGQTVFGSEIVQALPPLLKPHQHPGDEALSEREYQVLQLIADGLSNREIANKLFLSEGTVRNYVSQLLAKLDVRDRTQLVVRYYKGLDR